MGRSSGGDPRRGGTIHDDRARRGVGRWITNAAFACRQLGVDYRLVGVEAEKEHFEWMRAHLALNDVEPEKVTLVAAAAAASDGTTRFRSGLGATCYGQRVPRLWRERVRWRLAGGAVDRVPAVSLATVIADVEGTIDLLDLDIQSAEADVLEAAGDTIGRVRRIHVATHPGNPRALRDPEDRVRALFTLLGWRCLRDYGWGRECTTPEGVIRFEDGVQTWLNPSFPQK